ncbi:hypothetical protein CRE_22066 [Caenorhabditis remanei]|uniref:HAT C-terminal dimerisation domain-containing protein n=1 Tax=Caenorhabditis remanei TaxID=31234 RepID=E3N8U1_CAERE|nr:hypothetical protein CRE_22066 [Caenorhabditis remanei]
MSDGRSKCSLCSHVFNRQKHSCTTVLNYHFRKNHTKVWNKINGKTECDEDSVEPVVKKIKLQPTIQESFSNCIPDDTKNEKLNRSIMQLIAAAALPISFVDNPAWRNFCSIAIPKFKCKGRHQFQRQELNKVYEEYKRKITNELEAASFVSLGFDGWSDVSNKHQYLGVIAHFIQNDSLTFRVIGVIDIKSKRHTGDYLHEKLEEIAEEFEIKEKISCLVRDGGSDVKCAARLVGKPHHDCFAHKLNLAVKDGAESFKSLQSTLSKLRKIVNIVNKSGNARREFEEVSASLDVPPLSLKKHIEVRWNTIHAVFERALKVRETIDFLSTERDDWPKLTATDWKTAESVVEILQPIVDATLLIQNRGMTSSAIIPLCKVLIRELDDVKKFREFCTAMTKKLREELEKYDRNSYLQFGMLLDVRFKAVFADDVWKTRLLERLIEYADESEMHEEISDGVSPVRVADNPFSRFMREKTPELPQKSKFGNQNEIIAAEVQRWFNEPCEMDENPIRFWNRASSQEKFPNLYNIHEEFLSAPATTAEAERLFSSARTILTDNRKLLSAENFSKLLFLQQNTRLLGFGPQTVNHI